MLSNVNFFQMTTLFPTTAARYRRKHLLDLEDLSDMMSNTYSIENERKLIFPTINSEFGKCFRSQKNTSKLTPLSRLKHNSAITV